LDQIGI